MNIPTRLMEWWLEDLNSVWRVACTTQCLVFCMLNNWLVRYKMGGVVGGLERSSLCFSLLVSLIRLYYELNGPHKVAIYSCGDIIRYDSAGMNGSFTNHIQYYYCFHVISWKFRHHQVGLLNVDGFYDPLLSFIDLAVNEGFITEAARHVIISAPTAKELVMKLEVWPGPLLTTLLLFIFNVPTS